MTRDEAVARIKQGLGFRTDLDNVIVLQMQEAQRMLEGGHKLPWFIINEDSPINIVSGQAAYTLTDRFIREVDAQGVQSPMRSINGNEYFVRKMDYDKAVSRYGFESTGTPAVYALRSTSIVFFPTPDADDEYRWSFYQRQDPLTDDIENEWLRNVPDLLIGMAGEMTAGILRDADAKAVFAEQRARWESWLTKEMEIRDQGNMVYVMGSDL